MGKNKDRKQVNDTYNRNLSSWALRERARLGGLSYRAWADKISEETGVKVGFTVISKWIRGSYKEEMEKRALDALSRWRKDPSPEHTRQWLWGETLYDAQEFNRVLAWLKTAKKEEVAEVVKEGMKVVFEPQKEEPVQLELPPIALKIQQQGINIDTLLKKSLLDDEEQQEAILYLMGKIPEMDIENLKDLEFTLDALIKRQGSKKRKKNQNNHQPT